MIRNHSAILNTNWNAFKMRWKHFYTYLVHCPHPEICLYHFLYDIHSHIIHSSYKNDAPRNAYMCKTTLMNCYWNSFVYQLLSLCGDLIHSKFIVKTKKGTFPYFRVHLDCGNFNCQWVVSKWFCCLLFSFGFCFSSFHLCMLNEKCIWVILCASDVKIHDVRCMMYIYK